MKFIDLKIRKDGDYWWVTSESVRGLIHGGNSLSKVLQDVPDIIDELVELNKIQPLQDWKEDN